MPTIDLSIPIHGQAGLISVRDVEPGECASASATTRMLLDVSDSVAVYLTGDERLALARALLGPDIEQICALRAATAVQHQHNIPDGAGRFSRTRLAALDEVLGILGVTPEQPTAGASER